MNYTIRENCIICNEKLENEHFEKDYENYVAHYSVDPSVKIDDMVKIPFNVCVCGKCNTPQNKYLADLNEVYRLNHADSTGSTMKQLHEKNLELVLKYKDNIKNIIEIGSSKGVLSDLIIPNMETQYNIIEPSFFGDRTNKIIFDDFYENVDDSEIDANTVIISHVFEHFYKPMEILEKISKNDKIENFFLVFPDLEYYINNNVLHVLNTEHTYYVDNSFLVKVMEAYGFKLVEEVNHKNHSVLFYFKRDRVIEDFNNINIDFKNDNFDLDIYYSRIMDTVSEFNENISSNDKVFVWPASIHTLYLFGFGLDSDNLTGFLDNSKIKIGGKMYGTDLLVYDFKEMVKNDDNVILTNGGVFNKEVEHLLKK